MVVRLLALDEGVIDANQKIASYHQG